MRERITFIQKLGDSQEPSAFKINGGVISGPEIDAVREDKLTFALDDLPSELHTLLYGIHELHVRWVSPVASETVAPFLARLPPGFHLFFTPGKEGVAALNDLCPTLSKVFGSIECSTPTDSFTSLPSDRFSHSAALQYFQPLEDLSRFIQYAKHQLCSNSNSRCVARLDRLAHASSLEVSYDTISHALKITALWPYQHQSVYAASQPQSRTEVGVLSADMPPGLEPNELGISGLLTVLDQDSESSPVVFSFASRHQDANSGFSTSFLEPTGLHPTLQIQLESNQPPSDDASCSAHAYLTLPRNIFADKYQLADDLFLASKNLTALRYISQPVDLEAPEYVMKSWGSAVLLELSPPDSEKAQSWTAGIPLHLRYLLPAKGGYESIQIPYPAVFWACTAEEGTKFPSNPFDRVNLGYDGLFGPRTVFWHVEPRPVGGNRLENTVKVPVLDLDKSQWVNAGTAIVVLAGFTWIMWKLAAVLFRSGHGGASPRGAKSVKEKKQQ
ncbi:PIG-X [Podospora appendiculata]|uniref:Protein PBN1 n=1 Tax=Podospora appendiculata TaxID=314037 RepID=A0AAE1CFQ2_9PEZI|nr:PIG-X [Podospora appendiculata]